MTVFGIVYETWDLSLEVRSNKVQENDNNRTTNHHIDKLIMVYYISKVLLIYVGYRVSGLYGTLTFSGTDTGMKVLSKSIPSFYPFT